jgi:protein-S-isoprenylcysteine O-methyltransferase
MHWPLACFLAALLFFHCSEAALAYAFNPDDAGKKSTPATPCFSLRAEARFTRLALQLAVCARHGVGLRGVRAGVAAGARAEGASRACSFAPPGDSRGYLQGAPALLPVQWLGLALVLSGEALRKAGILTAGHNFTHMVQVTRRPRHTLVKHGVYAHVRHPGYLGWFIWAVSTQLLLLNPICSLGFAGASWLYFRRRIRFEEARLLQFFGAEYRDYMARTPTYIPGL